MDEAHPGCVPVTHDILTDPIHIKVSGMELDFETAQKLATAAAEKLRGELMLMGWYDRKAERYWPNVDCCGKDKPSWLIYAESRGADITIDINDEEFVFVFFGE